MKSAATWTKVGGCGQQCWSNVVLLVLAALLSSCSIHSPGVRWSGTSWATSLLKSTVSPTTFGSTIESCFCYCVRNALSRTFKYQIGGGSTRRAGQLKIQQVRHSCIICLFNQEVIGLEGVVSTRTNKSSRHVCYGFPATGFAGGRNYLGKRSWVQSTYAKVRVQLITVIVAGCFAWFILED